MHPEQDQPPDDRDDRDPVIIPRPRPAPDDEIENLPENGPDLPVWRYNQSSKRGKNRQFTGYITSVGGAEGERLRGELAAVIRDLLSWAQQQSDNRQPGEDGDDAQHPR